MKRTGVNGKKRFTIGSGLDKRSFGDCDPKTLNDNRAIVEQQGRYFLVNLDTQEREELPSDALIANGWYPTEWDFWKTPFEFVNQDKIESLAMVCSAINDGIDHKQEIWEQIHPSQQVSSFKSVSFRMQNPDAAPSEQHRRWMELKLADGWKFGPKDFIAKTHPNLVPYEQLCKIQELKDKAFQAVCALT